MRASFLLLKPYEFRVGAPPGKERKREFVDNPNGLFSAQAAPKPPPAMYTIVEGMRVGGKVTLTSFYASSFVLLIHSSKTSIYFILCHLFLCCHF